MLAGVVPARAVRSAVGDDVPRSRPPGRAPRSHPPRGVWSAVAEVVSVARALAAGTEDRCWQRAAESSVFGAIGFATAGPVAERLNSAALTTRAALRRAAAAVDSEVSSASGDLEAAASWEPASQRRLEAAASECEARRAGRGFSFLAAQAAVMDGLLAEILLRLATAPLGLAEASSRDAGAAQGGRGGIVCHWCSGMGEQQKASLVTGCWPRISRVQIVRLAALRGWQASLRPTDDSVE